MDAHAGPARVGAGWGGAGGWGGVDRRAEKSPGWWQPSRWRDAEGSSSTAVAAPRHVTTTVSRAWAGLVRQGVRCRSRQIEGCAPAWGASSADVPISGVEQTVGTAVLKGLRGWARRAR